MKIPVIIDTDPGIDDALAILLAARSPEFQIEAITTVAGNVPLPMATNNALRILEVLGEDRIPVFAGANQPLHYPLPEPGFFHGTDGLADCDWPQTQRQPEPMAA